MTIKSSPPPPSHQVITSTQRDFPGPSKQITARPPPHLSDGGLKSQNSTNFLNDQGGPFGKQRLTNGHASGDVANGGQSLNLSPEQQAIIRSRTENQKLPHRSRAQLMRTQTDFGPKHQVRSSRIGGAEEVGELRHGWEDQYNSSEFLGLLSSVRH